ncbi:MAG: hypothetical protein IM631_05125 [Cytophagales bacterium]|nr:hypothetical protein [Cytophagales bacterium]MCA6370763.1 hypothetical protein [Cytophagales bacterium]MCA6385925.1 hypothetical protein [Cytophagales bacterium]
MKLSQEKVEQCCRELKEYAEYRKRNVENGLESEMVAYLLCEKYFEGYAKALNLEWKTENYNRIMEAISESLEIIGDKTRGQIEKRNTMFTHLGFMERV